LRSDAQLLPVPIDMALLRRSFADVVPPLWRELIRSPRRASARRGSWADELASLAENDRAAAVLEVVRGEVARVLSLSEAGAVEAERPLKELGLDSLMAVELRNALGRRAGARLPATLAFDHPTPAAIAKYIIMKLGFAIAGKSAVTKAPKSISSERKMTIVEALSFIREEYERAMGDA
jgi:acyl carrier protein